MFRPSARLSILGTLIALATFLGGILGSGSASAATPDCANTHCYSYGTYTANLAGGVAAIPLTNMWSGPASYADGNHINSEMWVQLDSSGEHYIEAGIKDGFQRPDGFNHCWSTQHLCLYDSFEPGSGGSSTCEISGCGAYELFWADTGRSGSYEFQYEHVVRFLSPNPNATEDVYIYYSGGGTWTIEFTGAYSFTATSGIESSYSQTKKVLWGAEYEGPKNNGECGASAPIGAYMLQSSQGVFKVISGLEINAGPVNPPFTGSTRRSGYTWSAPGTC